MLFQMSKCYQSLLREKAMPRSPTKASGSRVHVDFASSISGVAYILLVDSSSKWLEVISVVSTNTAATVNAHDRIFTTLGFSETLVSQFEEYWWQNLLITYVRPTSPPNQTTDRAIWRHHHKFPAESKGGGGDGGSYSIASTDSQDDSLSNTGEVLRERMVGTANHAMIPKMETNEPGKGKRRGFHSQWSRVCSWCPNRSLLDDWSCSQITEKSHLRNPYKWCYLDQT